MLCAGTGLLCEARLLREGLWLREDLLPADHASSRSVLRSEGPVCLQALLCVRGLRSGEGLLCSGTGLLCEARLLCPGSRLLLRAGCTGLLCEARLLREACLLREGLRLREEVLPHRRAAMLLCSGLLREARLAVRSPLAARRLVVARLVAAEEVLPSSAGRPGQRHLHREVPDLHRLQV